MRYAIVCAIALCLPLSVGCELPSKSSAKFDTEVARILSLNALTIGQKDELCSRSPLIVFIGNAEPSYATLVPGSKHAPAPKVDANQSLYDVVKVAEVGFRNALRKNDCWQEARAMKDRGDRPPVALFVSIVDGPDINDSTIHTTWFGWNERMDWVPLDSNTRGLPTAPFTQWMAGRDNIVKVYERSFELHLPTQLQPVVEFFFKQKPPLPGYDDFVFDETLYYIKSHGGRFLPADRSPTLDANLRLAAEAQAQKPGGAPPTGAKHAFLYDSHGPEDKLYTADLFNPFWLLSSGCKLVAAMTSFDATLLSLSGMCSTCTPTLNQDHQPLGAFAKCPGLAVAKAASSGQTLNGNDQSTLNGNDQSTLNGNDQSTLGGLGSLLLSGDVAGLLGAGKSFYYSHSPTPTLGEATNVTPDGVYQVASAVSYDAGDQLIPGIYHIDLPGGSLPPPNNSQKQGLYPRRAGPTFLLLDSCYGSPGIALAIGGLFKSTAAPDVVVMNNPDPVQSNIVNYSALNITQHLMVPHIQSWYAAAQTIPEKLNYMNGVVEMRKALNDHMSKDGLIDMARLETALAAAQHSGQAFVIEDWLKREAKVNPNHKRFSLSTYTVLKNPPNQ